MKRFEARRVRVIKGRGKNVKKRKKRRKKKQLNKKKNKEKKDQRQPKFIRKQEKKLANT